MREINLIVIHCSATRENQDVPAKNIEQAHRDRGYLRAGYHYYIRRNGTMNRMRPLAMVGAHAAGHNVNSIGICYEGGLDTHGRPRDTRTQIQRYVMRNLVRALLSQFPNAAVRGHRDLSPDLNKNGVIEENEYMKQCPCFDVLTEL